MPNQIVIDCYGFRNTDTERYRKQKEQWCAVSEDAAGNIYFRFRGSENGPIHRISEDAAGNIVRRWAYGSWSNREQLSYDYALSDAISIPEE